MDIYVPCNTCFYGRRVHDGMMGLSSLGSFRKSHFAAVAQWPTSTHEFPSRGHRAEGCLCDFSHFYPRVSERHFLCCFVPKRDDRGWILVFTSTVHKSWPQCRPCCSSGGVVGGKSWKIPQRGHDQHEIQRSCSALFAPVRRWQCRSFRAGRRR